MRDVYVARQPIFDRQQQVYAYEVLFRNSQENRAVIDDAARATSELLSNAFVTIGLDRIVGTAPAFINLTREFFTGELPLPMASERLVLEVLEDIEIDEPLVCGVQKLVDDGFRIALDDVVFEERLRPLLPLATFVKVELPRVPRDEWGRQLEQFREYDVTVLAEKVETQEDFDLCRQLGYDLMQGYFFSRPQMLTSREVPGGQLALLQLMGQLNRPDVTIEDIERTLRTDANLSFKLLRFINSARCGVPRRVESLHQVIQFLGLRGVRSLVMIVSTSNLTCQRPETLRNATLRALLCEKLGRRVPGCDSSACYMAGLVSALDAVLDMPFEEIAKLLPLSEEILGAVAHRMGPIGEVVRCAESHERLDPSVDRKCGNLSGEEVRACYLESLADIGEIFA